MIKIPIQSADVGEIIAIIDHICYFFFVHRYLEKTCSCQILSNAYLFLYYHSDVRLSLRKIRYLSKWITFAFDLFAELNWLNWELRLQWSSRESYVGWHRSEPYVYVDIERMWHVCTYSNFNDFFLSKRKGPSNLIHRLSRSFAFLLYYRRLIYTHAHLL